MSWQVTWNVISGGPAGPRRDDSRGVIYRGERVRFVISLSPDTPNYLGVIRQAGRSANWDSPPTLAVIGHDGARTVRVTARSTGEDALQIEYLFQYEGDKRLVFTGTAGQYDIARLTTRSIPSRPEAGFPPLQLELNLRVQNWEIGAQAATTQGTSSRGFRRAAADLEATRGRIDRLERAAERSASTEREEAEAVQRAARAGERPGRDASPGQRRAYAHGLLHFPVQDEPTINRMTGHDLETYFRGLNAAIRITPPFRLYGGGSGSRPIGAIRVNDSWQVEYRPGSGQIAFFLEGSLSATVRSTPRGAEYYVPTPEARESYREGRRAETLHIFPENAWLVVQTGPDARSMMHVRELAETIERNRFWATVEGFVTLGEIALAAVSLPAMSIRELGLEIISELFIPAEVQTGMAGASVLRGLVSGLRNLLRGGRRAFRGAPPVTGGITGSPGHVAGSPTASPVAPAPGALSGRGTGGGSRGVPPGSGGGTGGGGFGDDRESVYLGPPRPVEGFFDLDGRPNRRALRRTFETGVPTPDQISRFVLDAQATREYRVALAMGRDGRRVTRLPESDMEWRSLETEIGSQAVSDIRRRLDIARSFDRLSPSRNPDLLVDGRIWDVVSQEIIGSDHLGGVTSALLDAIRKVNSGQSRRIIVDMTRYTPIPGLPEVRDLFRRSLSALEADERGSLRGMEELAVMMGDRVFTIFSRGSGISF